MGFGRGRGRSRGRGRGRGLCSWVWPWILDVDSGLRFDRVVLAVDSRCGFAVVVP